MCAAEGITKEQARELDEQVQDIKQEVLDLSGKLIQLEEKLIYPPKTRISIFLTLAPDKKIPLGAVKIKLDRKEKHTQTVDIQDLDAMQRGGAQRIYNGNIQPGTHVMEVAFMGNSSGDKDNWIKADYAFTKGAGPKIIEVVLSGLDSGNKNVSFRD